MQLSPGTRLGGYEITGLLGAGGMGEVYRARDTRLGRDVALKLLPTEFTHDPDRVARFQREAKTLASLNHQNIGGIYGLEEANGLTALVLELVEGPTLADRIAQGSVPLDEALLIARQIAEALETAHEQGIIHRDLKPANIKVRTDGAVKVLDFGLAKALEPSAGSSPNVSQSPTITTPAMTQAGMILGTAAYMSPEQAKGRPADKRSDVWSFACVLFEMLTGHRAFAGDDVSDTLAAVLRGEPEWSTLPRGVPVSVRTLIQRCLVKDRRQRAADIAVARFVLADPNALAQSLEAPTAVPDPRRRSRWQTIGALGAAIAVTAIVVGAAERMWRPANPVHPVMRARFGLPSGQLLSNLGRHALAISPDGTKMAYFASGRLFLRGRSEFEGHEIGLGETAAPNGLTDPVFSPDGRSIAFQSAGAIRRIAVTGGAAVTICPAETTFGMSWDAEAGLVFGQGAKGVLRCPENGGSPEQLLAVKPQELAYGPQLLPGGRALLLTIANTADGPARWDKARIIVQPLPSGQPTTLISGGTDARYLPTGHLVYQFGGVVFAIPFDAARLAVSGGPVSVVEGVRGSASKLTGAAQFAIAQDGTFLYIPGPVGASDVGSIAFADRGGTVTPLSLPPRAYTHVRASRDGERLAIGTDDGRDAIVWIDDLKASAAIRRLTLVGHNRFPIWSPDGQRVAYQSDRDGDVGIFVQRAEGAGEAERLTKPGEGEVHIPESWSPDGKYLAFSVAKGGRYAISMLSLDDRKVAPFGDLQSSEPMGPVFSPDGAWVAYYVNPADAGGGATNANRGIFVQPFPVTPERYQVPNQRLDFHPVWTSNGKELIYVPSALSGTLAVIGVTTHPTVTFSRPVLIPARVTGGLLSSAQRAYDILPDGRFVGLTSPSDAESTSPNAEILVVSNWFEELKARVPTK